MYVLVKIHWINNSEFIENLKIVWTIAKINNHIFKNCNNFIYKYIHQTVFYLY